jgi:hypothetical protein
MQLENSYTYKYYFYIIEIIELCQQMSTKLPLKMELTF